MSFRLALPAPVVVLLLIAGFGHQAARGADAVGVVPAGSTANDYSLDQNWLCRPGRADVCSRPTTATVLEAGGGRRTVTYDAAPAPPIDCFYVYPTVSAETSPNSDMASTGVEEATATAQFAPFAAQCRTFAPRYRSVTVAGLHSALSGGPRPDTAMAYRDVLDAWHSYLANDNHGRGVVLIGHSQGAKILARLIAAEIDGQPLQARFVSAIIPGTLIETPLRADAGGTYAHVALCASASDLGCVIAYSTYLDRDVPVDRALFGVTKTDGRGAACVDPAKLVGSAFLDPEFPSRLSPATAIETTFIEVPGVVEGRCVTRDGQTVLAIGTADDPRASSVARGLAAMEARRPTWGLHALDMNLALGDLVAIVSAQAKAWSRK